MAQVWRLILATVVVVKKIINTLPVVFNECFSLFIRRSVAESHGLSDGRTRRFIEIYWLQSFPMTMTVGVHADVEHRRRLRRRRRRLSCGGGGVVLLRIHTIEEIVINIDASSACGLTVWRVCEMPNAAV